MLQTRIIHNGIVNKYVCLVERVNICAQYNLKVKEKVLSNVL